MKKSKIFFFEDHPLMILGIGALIDKEPDFILCGSSSDPKTFLDDVKKESPNAVVLDIALYTQPSVDLIRNLRQENPEISIIVLSVHRQMEYMQKALEAGANAYVLKIEDPEILIEAIRSALAGKTYKSKKIDSNEKQSPQISDSPINRLSRREFEILQDIGKGFTDRQIAENRNMDSKAVESEIMRIREKLDLENHSELLQFAVHWVHHEGGFH